MKKPSLEQIHIAIDGPVASGKGTVARALSAHLGIPCLDTGAIYRGYAVAAFENGITADNISDIEPLLPNINVKVEIVKNITQVSINSTNVTQRLRDNEISKLASAVATLPYIRKLVVKQCQEIAEKQSLIAEGRDICNIVLPTAKYKFYLTSDIKTRSKRRYEELRAKGHEITLKQTMKQIKARDKNDQKNGGFKKVKNAVVIDSTSLTVDEAVKHMLGFINEFKLCNSN